MNRHVLWRRRAPLDSEGLGPGMLEALSGNLALPWVSGSSAWVFLGLEGFGA